jgi:hypothetical protein
MKRLAAALAITAAATLGWLASTVTPAAAHWCGGGAILFAEGTANGVRVHCADGMIETVRYD